MANTHRNLLFAKPYIIRAFPNVFPQPVDAILTINAPNFSESLDKLLAILVAEFCQINFSIFVSLANSSEFSKNERLFLKVGSSLTAIFV